jgi:Protein of unknown function (DUF3800)
MPNKKNYFVFADESGTLLSERFFGIGILMIDRPYKLYDSILSCALEIRELSRKQREKTIIEHQNKNNLSALSKLSIKNDKFELKYTKINSQNNSIYKKIIRNYFNFFEAKFSVIIIDRDDPNFKPYNIFTSTWDMYSSFFSTLIIGNLKNMVKPQLCILPDYLNISKKYNESFEETILNKIKRKLSPELYYNSIFNICRLESHSNLLIQLVDILLGCVLYDFKLNEGLITPNIRKGPVVDELRSILKRKTLYGNYTINNPSYFSVWKIKLK